MKSKERFNTYNINIPDPAPVCTLNPAPQAWVIFRKEAPGLWTKPSSTHSPTTHHSPGWRSPGSAHPGGVVRARGRLPAGATTEAPNTPLAASVPAASNLAVSSRLTDDPVSGQLLPQVTSLAGKEHKVPRKLHKFHLVLNTPRNSRQTGPFAKESLLYEGLRPSALCPLGYLYTGLSSLRMCYTPNCARKGGLLCE